MYKHGSSWLRMQCCKLGTLKETKEGTKGFRVDVRAAVATSDGSGQPVSSTTGAGMVVGAERGPNATTNSESVAWIGRV